MAAVVKELEGKKVREIKCRDDKLADLQEQLDAQASLPLVQIAVPSRRIPCLPSKVSVQ